MDKRSISEAYAKVGADLIETEPELEYIKDSIATIVYLESEHEKKSQGRVIYAQCERVPEKYKWAVPCDFTVTIFRPNVERFTDEQLKVLIFHELLHVGIRVDGNEEIYSIVPHDVEDFRTIIERFGIDWSEE